MELDVPQWIWNRIEGIFDRVESSPRLPLSADEWEIAIGDDKPPEGNGWYLVDARACEQSYRFQGYVMTVWARRKGAKT